LFPPYTFIAGIVGLKRHCNTTDLKMMLFLLFIVQKKIQNWYHVTSFFL
jgi:hypothetical protein